MGLEVGLALGIRVSGIRVSGFQGIRAQCRTKLLQEAYKEEEAYWVAVKELQV